jgi:hypothetical protein
VVFDGAMTFVLRFGNVDVMIPLTIDESASSQGIFSLGMIGLVGFCRETREARPGEA